MEILIGILCGLVLSLFFSFGPGFFGLIQNSITYGFRKGIAFEMGMNASDIFMVVLMLVRAALMFVVVRFGTHFAQAVGGFAGWYCHDSAGYLHLSAQAQTQA